MNQSTAISSMEQSCLPLRFSPNAAKMQKCWKLAQLRVWDQKQLARNNFIDSEYTLILIEIKKLFAKEAPLVFERDYREDKTASAQAMHCFVTPSFYFYLECDLAFNYRVEYAFGYCRLNDDILTQLNSLALDDCLFEVPLPLPFYLFYRMVQHAQPVEYFYTLEGRQH
ncbi:hypothetical protein [Mucilaginibacter sp. CSA2-8R]|uniref:hypothetical protein n=1 Tax=Mucilaginibacter sp. CSA2-8R TaxID=3141542 RepID=UPI00315C6435